MFTGIIRGLCPLEAVDLNGDTFGRITIRHTEDMIQNLRLGDSVAIDGVCLTATEIKDLLVTYDVIKSTLSRTIIGEYMVGIHVNLERSLKPDGEIGGHEVSGHVDTTAIVESIDSTPGNRCVFFRLPCMFGKYVFPRGFITINGVSLTVSDCLDSGSLFSVWLIPETIRVTNLGSLHVGQRVNVELHRGVQVLVDTLERSVQKFLQQIIENQEPLPDRVNMIERLATLFLPQLKNPESENLP